MRELNTTAEWMHTLSGAILNQDWDAVDRCRNATENWMQADEEREAQEALLTAVEATMGTSG